MWTFNLVITTAAAGRYHHLLRELSPLGEFRPTEFFGVILGRVNDPLTFLEEVRAARQRQVIAFQDLGRAVPLTAVFTFRAEEFVDKLRAAIRPFIPALFGRRFYVRLERRGLKGEIVSPEVERALDGFILAELAARGETAEVDFDDPEAVVAVETVGDRCGMGLLDREMLERFEFVRVG